MKDKIDFYNKEQLKLTSNNLYMVSSGSIFLHKLLNKNQTNIYDIFNISCEGSINFRYYKGLEVVDKIEKQTEDMACEIFEMNFACVQPHSGTQANLAVYDAILKDGDTVLCPHLSCGGHLSHFSSVSISKEIKKNLNIIYYHRDENLKLNYDEIEDIALKNKPNLIICGYSSYTFPINFKRFKEIAKKSQSILMADISHISGLIASKKYNNDFSSKHADIITSTTYKTLLGSKGGIILSKDENLMIKIRKSVFPRTHGTQNISMLFNKFLALKCAKTNAFKDIMNKIVNNTNAMISAFKNIDNIDVFGKDSHHIILFSNCFKKNNKNIQLVDKLALNNVICNTEFLSKKCFNKFTLNSDAIRIGTTFTTLCNLNEEDHFNIAKYIGEIIKYDSTFSCKYIDSVFLKYKNFLDSNVIIS